ncbi:protein of unknown function DUF547 [Macleaya cordata]|uniref:DUF547 domain-containing protein n=1 Tax=Macleaya cordata TaxID=56857 RepID=A0A200PR88_MACCD|nr:protein of unknown function DUF547 [Macleaya cordata]
MQSSAELISEIATLEVEVMHLERYLLSLYRTAFENHLATLSPAVMDQGCSSDVHCQTGSAFQDLMDNSCCYEDVGVQRSGKIQHNTIPSVHGPTNNHISYLPPRETIKRVPENADSGLRSLADHLGASLLDHIPEMPDRLSEEIVRCMTAIYCRLANSPLPCRCFSASPTLSLSSTTFSLQGNWSPHYSWETTEYLYQHEGLKKDINGPYSTMVEVPKTCLDDERISYVASMLQNFRSLVRQLEIIDPRKMKHEEKLTFWINIHNALVMHAYLVYGIHQNHMSSTSLVLKAAYNVGGHSITAYDIQIYILGCCSCHSPSWLHTFFTPGTKPQNRSGTRHTYALDYQEPLVYFALSSGAYSDPAVRVYTAKHVFRELNIAKLEFIQASTVSIYNYKGTSKVILPKVLHHFAKDASLNLYGLVEMVHGCLSEAQQKAMERCQKGKPDKRFKG